MARRTTRQLLDRADLVFLDQPLAESRIVGRTHPGHVEHLVARPEIWGWISMAVQAPRHEQGCLLEHEGHAVHLAVAGGAPDAFSHVDAVIEIHEIREIVDADPLERLVFTEARPDGLEDR